MKPNLKFTLERLISAFSANSDAFSRNNEALRRLIHQAESGELTHEKFRALADPVITEADVLQERRRELKAAYNDAMERLRIATAQTGRTLKGSRKRRLSLILMTTTATVFAVGEVYAHAFEWTEQMCSGAPSLCQTRDLLACAVVMTAIFLCRVSNSLRHIRASSTAFRVEYIPQAIGR
jgi:hypothetical protein